MAQMCGFFDANLIDDEFDRVYIADQFAQYFASFIGNGVFNLPPVMNVEQQVPKAMGVTVRAGRAWINGYWYRLTEDMNIPIDMADGTRDRIDLVVLRWGRVERDMFLEVIKGTPSTNPVPPQIVRSSEYYDLCLAQVRINRGSVTISNQNITDTRMDNRVCGFVTGLVKQADTTTLYQQFEDFYNNFVTVVAQEFVDWSAEQRQAFIDFFNTSRQNFEEFFQSSKDEFDEFFQTSQTAFNEWFASIKDILDEETAGHLLNLIQALDLKVDTAVSEFEEAVERIEREIMETHLVFENVTVPITAFVDDTTYPDYPYKVTIPLTGVNPNSIVTVNFGMVDATSGSYSPITESADNICYLYAREKPETNLIIPTIVSIEGAIQ